MKNNTLGTIITEYDENGNLTLIKPYVGEGKYHTVKLEYDDKQRIVGYLNHTIAMRYEYDSSDRVTHTKRFTKTEIVSSDNNTLSSIKYKHDRDEFYSYNDYNQLVSSHIINNNNNIEEYYNFDVYGNIIYQKTISEKGVVEHYNEYDESNRVIYTKDIYENTIKEYWFKYYENNDMRVYKEAKTYKNV